MVTYLCLITVAYTGGGIVSLLHHFLFAHPFHPFILKIPPSRVKLELLVLYAKHVMLTLVTMTFGNTSV